MNLQNLNITEMTQVEMTETCGGMSNWMRIAIFAACCLAIMLL